MKQKSVQNTTNDIEKVRADDNIVTEKVEPNNIIQTKKVNESKLVIEKGREPKYYIDLLFNIGNKKHE